MVELSAALENFKRNYFIFVTVEKILEGCCWNLEACVAMQVIMAR